MGGRGVAKWCNVRKIQLSITDFEDREMVSCIKGCGQPLKSGGAMTMNYLYSFTLSCKINLSIFNFKIF